MRKRMRKTAAAALALGLLCTGSAAVAAETYVSIRELRETLPERWVGDYVVQNGAPKQLKKGDTVSVDVPIVVPHVDKVPVVRITWEPPGVEVEPSVFVHQDEWAIKGIGREYELRETGYSALPEHVTFDPALPWENAPAIAIQEFKKWMPFMQDKELTCYDQRSYGDSKGKGLQCLHFYTTYHGIPHLIGECFLHEVKSERTAAAKKMGKATVPSTMVMIRLKRPGQFWTNITTAKEVGVDIADIPLLPFEKILKTLEQRVTAGYAYSLDEVRFGYMVFIDPEKKSEEFVLLPIWAAKGRTRNDLNVPFDLKTDQAVLDRGGYHSNVVIVVNAQTGETYDFAGDKRPDRRYIPPILTWDEVK